MKLFILEYAYSYEGSDCCGVFSSLKEIEDAIGIELKSNGFSFSEDGKHVSSGYTGYLAYEVQLNKKI